MRSAGTTPLPCRNMTQCGVYRVGLAAKGVRSVAGVAQRALASFPGAAQLWPQAVRDGMESAVAHARRGTRPSRDVCDASQGPRRQCGARCERFVMPRCRRCVSHLRWTPKQAAAVVFVNAEECERGFKKTGLAVRSTSWRRERSGMVFHEGVADRHLPTCLG